MPISEGYDDPTQLHPIAIGALLIGGFLILLLPKRNSLKLFLIISILIPFQQRIDLAGINMIIMRILIFITFIRFFFRNELHRFKPNGIDKVVILWIFISAIINIILWQTGEVVINRIGFIYNALGLYILFKVFIQDIKDIDMSIKTLIIVASVIALTMFFEQVTGRNLFSVFGVPEFTQIREGRLRSQGPFAVCITAGTFGATLLPLIISLLWADVSNKFLVVIGVISSTVITLTSASSGPVLTYLAVAFGFLMWQFRRYMSTLKWGLIISLISLHVIMKAPVWALINHISVFTGSSSYHRYKLIDNFIMRINEWWLFGTKSTDEWGWMMWDTVNQYVLHGINGGLISLILFIMIITRSFRSIGRRIRLDDIGEYEKKRMWALGVTLFAHVVAFVGISYFDQIQVMWYLLLAMMSTLSDLTEKQPTAQYAKIKL